MAARLISAGGLGGLALLLVAGLPSTGRSARRRLSKLRPTAPDSGASPSGGSPVDRVGRPLVDRPSGGPATSSRPARPVALIRLTSGLAGLAVMLVIEGWVGLLAGSVVAVGMASVLPRLEPASARLLRQREAADLPLAADLLAAALRAGAPVDRAVTAVAEALGGPLGDRLCRVGRTLLLGGESTEAWGHLAPVAGADRLTGAAVRSAASGAALAGALTRLADDLRADRSVAAEAAARRAGVLIVLPLGLCFLPAFILAGLVPVIVAVLGDVL